MCVHPFLQDTLEKHQECLKKQREAVKYRLKKLAARQSEITVSCVQTKMLKFCHNMKSFCLYCDIKFENQTFHLLSCNKNTNTIITPVIHQYNKLINAYV